MSIVRRGLKVTRHVIFISFTRSSPPLLVNRLGPLRLPDLSDYAHVYKLLVIYYFMEFLLVFVLCFVCASIPGMAGLLVMQFGVRIR